MGIIRVLHEKVISQIAAGEVIERPASVVRELIDNSIDAGSGRVFVLIDHGGRSLIRVSDNGAGMVRDDLLLSIESHATSKIRSVSELFSIGSLGFRGEALPSIGAVSKMEITSRPHDQLSGHRLKVSGGRVQSIDEVGCPAGTVVEVRDLFFNMPARKKFLKGERTETDQVLDLLVRTGLPYHQIHFRMDAGERTLINLPSTSELRNRFPAVFGPDVGSSMVETSMDGHEFAIRLFLGDPEFVRSRADRILLYVNQRHVRDKLLMHAVLDGYGQRLMKGRYPQAVLLLTLAPSLVDVNVHPAKQEVRLQQGRLIHQAVMAAVQRGLGRELYPVSAPVLDAGPEHFAPADHPVQMALESPADYRQPEGSELPAPPEMEFRVLGQLRETYVLFESPEGLLVMDQHAAHERVVYEKLKRCYHGSPGPEIQAFLIPQRLEFSLKDAGAVTENLDSLRALGLDIEPFGGTTFQLRAVPSMLVQSQWEKLFSELIPVLEDGKLEKDAPSDRLLTVMACHGAIRAGQRLSIQEMSHLVRQLFATTLPTNCPHGRPTLRRFSIEELERSFRRTV